MRTPHPPPSLLAPLLLFVPFAASPAPTADAPRTAGTVTDGEAFHGNLLAGEAAACEQQGEYGRALNLYAEALAHDPGNAAAAAGRDGLLRRRGQGGAQGGARGGAMPRTSAEMRDLREQILFDFGATISDGESALAAGDLSAYDVAIERGRAAASTDPTLFSLAEIRRFNLRLTDLHGRLTRDPAAVAEQRRRDAYRRLTEAAAEGHRNREATVANLIAQARLLTESRQYDEAIYIVDQILVLDPRNDYAIGVRPMLDDDKEIGADRRMRQRRRQRGEQVERFEHK